jgi:hypothetical protein
MRTTDALMIGMALGRIRATLDAWEESKHPRQPDGKFGKGGGSSATKKAEEEYYLALGKAAEKKSNQQRKEHKMTREAIYKYMMSRKDLSPDDKESIEYGKKQVKAGKWSKEDFKNMVIGMAMPQKNH